MKTFKQAKREILAYLADHGWTVKDNLKIAHATNNYGDVRLWFKSQAIYIECGGKPFRFGDARSFTSDSRDVDPEGLAEEAEDWCR